MSLLKNHRNTPEQHHFLSLPARHYNHCYLVDIAIPSKRNLLRLCHYFFRNSARTYLTWRRQRSHLSDYYLTSSYWSILLIIGQWQKQSICRIRNCQPSATKCRTQYQVDYLVNELLFNGYTLQLNGFNTVLHIQIQPYRGRLWTDKVQCLQIQTDGALLRIHRFRHIPLRILPP